MREERQTTVEIIGERLSEAEDEMQGLRHNGDERAIGYAEQKVIMLRRELAMIDPFGVGHKHLDTLTDKERNVALS